LTSNEATDFRCTGSPKMLAEMNLQLRLTRRRLAACIYVCLATSLGCARFAPVRVGVRAPRAIDVAALQVASDPDLTKWLDDQVAQARTDLQTETVLRVLKNHQNTLDVFKWLSAALSAGTTAAWWAVL
jgi:hypothetical protein